MNQSVVFNHSVSNYQGVIARYRKLLPITSQTPVVSLKEGNTPLLLASHLAAMIGVDFSIYLKFEGTNPTGSFKDRGMTVAISKAVEGGARIVLCASTGNTAASAAAYAARAGLKAVVLLPRGAIALGKLSQALVHGAQVMAIEGNFDQCLQLARVLTKNYPVTLVNSINPYRIEGQKTAAFEIVDTLGEAPEYQFMPVGNAGNITAYWRGYQEYYHLGRTKKRPQLMGFQAEGAAPLVLGHPVSNPQTVATAIRIGNPASWEGAILARDESGGTIAAVGDEEILAAYRILAATEGIFAEPASAAGVAGLFRWVKERKIPRRGNFRVVCILTGHGLKDPDNALKNLPEPPVLPADERAVAHFLGF